jgi:FtsP/CotA-like multicopper oxidase with cupredoxin domain
MAVYDVKRGNPRRWLVAATIAGVLVLLHTLLPAHAQRLSPDDCLKPGEALLRMPELISQGGKLHGTIVLGDQLRRMTDTTVSLTECAQVYLRFFQGVGAVPAAVPPGTPAPPPSKYTDPLPGPTLRARVGDIVQLTFLNQVNPLNYGGSLDRGADAGACDQFSSNFAVNYPFADTFPNCFHGSSTANIHFHGTHTNPNSTGDNVFLNIRPSPRSGGQPIVTADSVAGPFAEFFKNCEEQLGRNVLSEWPFKWSDLPASWTQAQEKLIKAFDNGQPPYAPPAKPLAQQLWPANQKQLDTVGGWPQYYIGAYPHCFRLPQYTDPRWPPQSGVKMGQAPGTHWYHAHKHGSTALNVSNGMTGAFIIEGAYDDELNQFYGTAGNHPWTRVQPVLVINQLGGTPNLARGAPLGAQAFAVNGRVQPQLTMRPGEVQLWRIANTSSQSAAFLVGPPKADPSKPTVDPTTDFEWRQLAQDGVQFADPNYKKSQNISLMVAAGNRVDLLVKAPTNPKAAAYDVSVKQTVSAAKLPAANAILMSVLVSGMPPDNPRQRQFIPRAPMFPPFLADITDEEVKYSNKKTLTFDSKAPGTPAQHTINNVQFNEEHPGVTVFLNTVEEWKVENSTVGTAAFPGGPIDHPFHIHINPFQIVEVFDPNAQVVDPASGQTLPKYVTDPPTAPTVQCQINLNDGATWRDCHNTKQRYGIWWDVFPIPAGRSFGTGTSAVVVAGYFRMRSRFVDYPGLYVLHCHILAHEDRGMMTVVQVMPLLRAPVQHH